KATLIFAALAIMFMANMNVKGQCPEGWTGPVFANIFLYCDWTYEYCYYYDPMTLSYLITITDQYITEEPCQYYGYDDRQWGSIWRNIRKELRDSMMYRIVKELTTNVWTEESIPQCPSDFFFWFINTPACYLAGYYGGHHKDDPCPEKKPRDCDTARVVICWDYVYDDEKNIICDEDGNPIIKHYITRYWDPAISPEGEIYECPKGYGTENPCYDNCY
ncbi:MAG TPA: hypothetical protein PKY56_10970, partial [Candidatus Kapabacteria bacterium]|nr:hypothetical protein [Candidatus Kapabacteria bacterium]